MDPEAVIERARGTIDEALLTRTDGGVLGRKVLADDPLLAHLDDGEALQYLLAGATAPTRVGEDARRTLEVEGSYRTLLAVTDERVLLVAGSADGDRVVSFDYRTLEDVVARPGLVTDEVLLEEAGGPTWEVTVGAGSEVVSAAEYAARRTAAEGSRATDEGTGTAAAGGEGGAGGDGGDSGDGGGGGDDFLDGVSLAPDGSATIDSFLQDASTSESADRGREAVLSGDPAHPTASAGGTDAGPGDGGGDRLDGSHPSPGSAETDDAGATRGGPGERTPEGGDAGVPSCDGTEPAAARDAMESRSGVDATDPGAGGETPSSGGHTTHDAPANPVPESDGAAFERDLSAAPAPDGPLVRALFGAVVDEAAMPSVEGYASADVSRVVGDVEAHHQRTVDNLTAGELEAARAAAATVQALAREGQRLATEEDDEEAADRVDRILGATRGLLLDATLDLDDLSALSGSEPAALRRLLQGFDPVAFEHLVADLWGELGYRTTVTRSSKDQGVDVVARRSTPVDQTVVIQAKRYGPDTKVGREEVQQYASLHRQEPDADLVVVVTTGEFTGPAQEASPDLDVKLVDGARLVEILLERDLYGVVAQYA